MPRQQFAAMVNNIMLHFKSSLTPSALEYLSLFTVFFTGCFVPILVGHFCLARTHISSQ